MFQQSLETCEDECETRGRVERLLDLFISATRKSTVRNIDKSGTASLLLEQPFNRGRRACRAPIQENAFVWLDELDINGRRRAIHLPIPLDALAGCETT